MRASRLWHPEPSTGPGTGGSGMLSSVLLQLYLQPSVEAFPAQIRVSSDSWDPEPLLVDDLLTAGPILGRFSINFNRAEKCWPRPLEEYCGGSTRSSFPGLWFFQAAGGTPDGLSAVSWLTIAGSAATL